MRGGIWESRLEMSNVELRPAAETDNPQAVPNLVLPGHFAAAVLLAWLANRISLVPWRRSTAAHWTERARLLWPARVSAAGNPFLIPVMLYLAHRVLWPESAAGWVASGLVACLGALLGGYPLEREMFPRLRFRDWLGEAAATWGLRFSGLIALLAATLWMPPHLEAGAWAVAGVYLAFHFAMQWGLAIRFLRWIGFARPADGRLRGIVAEAAGRMGIRPPTAWLLGGVHALAFALPVTRELLFSERLLEVCSGEELSAVCAHELAHLGESRGAVAGRLLGSLSLFPIIFIVPVIHDFGLGFIALPMLTLLIGKFARWLSQRMEKRADQAATATQLNDGVYARALETLYRENQLPAVNVNDRQTHPHLYDRMLAAGITPDYPRPARPARMTTTGMVYCAILGMLLAVILMRKGDGSP